MYGTVARMKTKSGALEAFIQAEQRRPDGFLGTLVYRMDANPDELMAVILFRDKAAYLANAASPIQDDEYRMVRSLLQQDPEWNDGEVVFSNLPGFEV